MTHKNHFDGSRYAKTLSENNPALLGADIDWFGDMRQKAMDTFVEVGLPGPRVEEWKYTNLSSMNSKTYNTLNNTDNVDASIQSKIADTYINDIDGSKVVFVDGYFQSDLSDIKKEEGLILSSLSDYIKSHCDDAKALLNVTREETSLTYLNSALMTDGYVINVKQGIKLSQPIQIIYVASENSADKALRNKNFINVNANASAQIIESFVGFDNVDNWQQDVTNISVDKNAQLEIYQTQLQGNETIHMGETHVDLACGADFKHYSLNIGSKNSRTEIKPTLNGLHGNVDLRGAFLGRGGNNHDVFTHMKHLVPECESDQIYRGVLDKGGKSAFQGKVYVAKDAQLTNAEQSNKNLLLDRDAEANSKPELLIYADDVKCAHGATVGELDAEALFYLKSRGLDTAAAKSLLVEAFVAEVYDHVAIPAVKEKYLDLARAWLG
jgi:Fe-S cluster assembly protein SufD